MKRNFSVAAIVFVLALASGHAGAATKSNPLEGRMAETVFETGAVFRIEFLPGNTMKWVELTPGKARHEATEPIHVTRLGDGAFSVNWIEADGIAIGYSIDIHKKAVEAFVSWNDPKGRGGRSAVSQSGSYRFIKADGSDDTTPFTNLEIVTDFWNGFFNRHDASYADKYLAATFTWHSPPAGNGVEAFKADFAVRFAQKDYKDSTATIVGGAVEDDLVYLHSHKKLHAQDPGKAAVDIFRVVDGKIVEHWGI
jgi:predicted SnoaL-like aldol condensation-catalyzing enzyme